MFLILMKGHPGTGKSTLAFRIAQSLKCPLVDKDDIRNATLPIESFGVKDGASGDAHGLPPRANTVDSAALNSLSYEAMWNVAKRQLTLGLSVVVDCPLARAELFAKASSLARDHGARAVVVECIASDEEQWRRRLESRSRHSPATAATEAAADAGEETAAPPSHVAEDEAPSPTIGRQRPVSRTTWHPDHASSSSDWSSGHAWHKPATWDDIQRLLKGYHGCWKYDMGMTPHVTVDTSLLDSDAALNSVLGWLQDL